MSQSLPLEIKVGKILKFAFPTVLMMVFAGLYTMVDGLFVARYVGTDALGAVNIVFPYISVVIGIGVMLGTGGSAIVAKSLGEGFRERASKEFSLIVAFGLIVGIVVMIPTAIFLDECVRLLGATDRLFGYGKDYMSWIIFSAPFGVLALIFQSFFVTAAKPGLGLVVSTAGGVINIVLDYVLIAVCGMGTVGASIGTAIGNSVPGIFGLCYFLARRRGLIVLTKPVWSFRIIGKATFNGSSEMVTNLASAVTTLLFNFAMLRLIGEDGVAAITVALYLQFFLSTVFIGYSMGVAPVFSFHYGKRNAVAIAKLFRISMIFLAANAALWYAVAMFARAPLIAVFAPEGGNVFRIALQGWYLFAPMILFAGFNIFASAMFTAFSDGIRSAVISFLRTFVLLSTLILVLPLMWGVTGIWIAVPLAEAATLIVSSFLMIGKRHDYLYATLPKQ